MPPVDGHSPVPPSRRAARTGQVAIVNDAQTPNATTRDDGSVAELEAIMADGSANPSAPRALEWLDDDRVRAGASPAAFPEGTAYAVATPSLVGAWPTRRPSRSAVLAPLTAILLVGVLYVSATLFWPLHAVSPRIESLRIDTIVAPPAQPSWPEIGAAGIGVDGYATAVSSSQNPVVMASITKVVTALVVLESLPLAAGDQGPEFTFTAADRAEYWNYLAADESALDVPVGGVLTEYELLAGMLIGSAGNYAQRLVSTVYPNNALYAAAAMEWLRVRGIDGITVTDPTGIGEGNSATPEAMIALARRALAHPVIAEIVATRAIDLPGVGLIENTNGLLDDEGVVGVKTGSLFGAFNLLTAKDISVGEATVRTYAVALGQPDDEARQALSRDLFAQVESELRPIVALPEGSVVGEVSTLWGGNVDIVTETDAEVILWNGGSAATEVALALGSASEAGDDVGAVVVTGPHDHTMVDTVLAEDVPSPSAWWRLTHPLELFGLRG